MSNKQNQDQRKQTQNGSQQLPDGHSEEQQRNEFAGKQELDRRNQSQRIGSANAFAESENDNTTNFEDKEREKENDVNHENEHDEAHGRDN